MTSKDLYNLLTSRSAAGCLRLPRDPKGEGVWVVHPTKALNAYQPEIPKFKT